MPSLGSHTDVSGYDSGLENMAQLAVSIMIALEDFAAQVGMEVNSVLAVL